MEEKITISTNELLEMAVNELESIRVPVALADEIARPVFQAVLKIKAVMDVLNQEPPEPDKEEVKE